MKIHVPQKLILLLSSLENKIFLLSLSYWILLFFFSPGNKIILVVTAVWAFLYFIILKNLHDAVLSIFLLTLPILVGKTYGFELIPPNPLIMATHPIGYLAVIVIKPINLIAVGMAALLLYDLIKKKFTVHYKVPTVLLSLCFLSTGISTFLYSLNPEISALIFLQLLQIFIFFLYLNSYYAQKIRLTEISLPLLSASILFQACLVALQFLYKSRLGISIESFSGIVLAERTYEEYFITFRPFGTFGHANVAAGFVLPFMALFFAHGYFSKSLRSSLTGFACLGIILVSYSRSAWLASLVILLVLIYWFEKKLKINLVNYLKRREFLFGLPFIIGAFYFIVLPRMITSLNTFQPTGGGNFRLTYAKQAFQAISNHASMGVGLGISPLYIYQYIPNSVIQGFPEEIHNGYLLFALEAGIPALFFLLCFLFWFLITLKSRIHASKITQATLIASCMIGICAALFNALFEAYLIRNHEPFLEIYILIFFIGLLFAKQKKYDKKRN